MVEKIWEGTTTVLALDLVRISRDKSTLDAFLSVCQAMTCARRFHLTNLRCQWAEAIISSCPSSLLSQLRTPLTILKSALSDLSISYTHPIPPLLPRPALFLFGYVASCLYLLEHAIWANSEPEGETDVEVLRRWVIEGGFGSAVEEVRRTREMSKERAKADLGIVYGSKARL